MPEIDRLLNHVVTLGASDLHVTAGQPPYVRLRGDMEVLDAWGPFTGEQTEALVRGIMNDETAADFDQSLDVDFGYALDNGERFRVNVFRDRSGTGFVSRHIASKVPTADALGLPDAVRELCTLRNGLVVVTGPTGSGKSTTLAAMIDLINATRAQHVITIEDPVEFVHEPKRCLINQREVHSHTHSFARALRAALREDPDVVMVGEMRDRETVECALELAETGHLVFGTLHTNTALGTVSRIVDMFSAERQQQVRSILADSLRGVVAQTLCKTIKGGITAAQEILVVNSAVSSNIREGKYHYIESAMQTGRGIGMQTLNDALLDLVNSGRITAEVALSKAINVADLKTKLKGVGVARGVEKTEAPPAPAPPVRARAVPQKPVEDSESARKVRTLKESLREDPERIDVLNNLAWVLATDSNDQVRDGEEAIALASRAFSLLGVGDGANKVKILDTLAAAYAETGRFNEAAETVSKAIEVAYQENLDGVVEELNGHMTTYSSGRSMLSHRQDILAGPLRKAGKAQRRRLALGALANA